MPVGVGGAVAARRLVRRASLKVGLAARAGNPVKPERLVRRVVRSPTAQGERGDHELAHAGRLSQRKKRTAIAMAMAKVRSRARRSVQIALKPLPNVIGSRSASTR
jgi:hypothetical protein